jgi:ABC-2 type transport system ATP-binding protein
MTTALSIQQLSKIYGNGFEALKGIDLEVEQGDFFALLGPNGAGKSTTIGIISSLVNKTGGKVEIFGKDIDENFSAAKKEIGIVPQEFNFPNFEPVFDILVNQAGYYGLPRGLAEERAEKYLKKLDLWDKRFEASRHLSGGMKRRLMIARALIHHPRLLILDEPTAGVDIEMRRSMWEFLKELNEQGTTIILTTHYLEEAESLCRNIAIIDHGVIAKNSSMKNLLSQLHKEVLILDVENPIQQAPSLEGFSCELTDEHSLEVEISKEQSVNELFAVLTAAGIRVTSMRNKSNRLEELFVSLVKSNAA